MVPSRLALSNGMESSSTFVKLKTNGSSITYTLGITWGGSNSGVLFSAIATYHVLHAKVKRVRSVIVTRESTGLSTRETHPSL